MDRAGFATWVSTTSGVATRAELLGAGVSSTTIASRIRHGEWQRPFPAVFLLSPGTPTWEQRLTCVQKWIAGRGVFSHQTAAYLHGLRREPPAVLDVLVPPSIGRRSNARCTVRRTTMPLTRVGTPQRTSLPQTVVDLIDEASSGREVLEILIAAVQNRLNTADLTGQLEQRRRVRNRDLVSKVLAITDEGIESHLELAYRRRVERAHRLPHASRQKWELIRGRWIRSDCWYSAFRVRAELDGELAHPGRASDSDVMRDNDVRIALDEITLRYRWAHVWNQPCVVAGQVAAALRRGGGGVQPKRRPRGRAAVGVI